MYRQAAAQGPLHGVDGGPYTGGVRVVDAGKLPAGARQRLADALRGRADPAPIAYERPAAAVSSIRASWGAVVGVVVLVSTFVVGFDDPSSAWELQPKGALGIYALAGALFAFSVLAVVRRRVRAGGSELLPGRYLLPLDVVDVAAVDARGRQIVTVTPLGDARDARVRGAGRKTELVVTFEDRSFVVFPIRGDAGGVVTLRRLEHAQRLLEDLTYEKGLEEAFSHDPLFDVRVDASWAAVAPSDDAGPPSLRTRRSLVAGRTGTAIAAAGAIVVAFGSLSARNAVGDGLLFERAVRAGTPEAFDAYLVKGRTYRREAVAARERVLAAREQARADEAKRRRWQEEDEERRPATAASCLAGLRAEASPAHPEVPKLMDAIVARAEQAHDPIVPMVFERRLATPERVSERDLAAREHGFAQVFERVFSETCPASIVRFAIPAEGTTPAEHTGLFVRYDVTWPGRTWTLPRRGAPDATIAIAGMQIVFDVTLESAGSDARAKFRLTMPPPARPSMALRPRSIFAGGSPDDGTFDDRVYDAMTARAFDRLYDEVWSLFFDGDPRVPLRDAP